MRVLNIEVSQHLLEAWGRWFAPPEQPFVVPSAMAVDLGLADGRSRLSMELRDRFEIYGLGDEDSVVWLTAVQATKLPRTVIAAQAVSHLWPHEIAGREQDMLVAYIEEGRRASRHDEVPDELWFAAELALPGARGIAGTFPSGSGPNCFGAVMAAAGVPEAEAVWMQREPFEQWLAMAASVGGNEMECGTLLVWRSSDTQAQHAAVTLGGGWALHKPSQGWMSPTKVLVVGDVKASARQAGCRLQRYHLKAVAPSTRNLRRSV